MPVGGLPGRSELRELLPVAEAPGVDERGGMRMKPLYAYQMMHDYVYRVAKWPRDIDINAINAGMAEFKLAIDQNEMMRGALDDQARLILSLRKQIDEMRVRP